MLRTTVAGGWPAPGRYLESIKRYHRGETSEAEAEAFLRAAAAIAIREQKSTGVDVVMGGELFADPGLAHLPRLLKGIQAVRVEDEPEARPRAGGTLYRLSGTLEAPRGLGYAAGYRRERRLDPALVKAACPGPLTVLSFLVLTDPSAFGARPEAIDIVQKEVAALVAAGAREVQLDAVMEVTAVSLLHHDAKEVADALLKAFRGVRNVIRTIHLCARGVSGLQQPPAARLRAVLPIVDHLRTKVDRVLLECPDIESCELLGGVPNEMEVIAGIADVGHDPEAVEDLEVKVRCLLQRVPASRLWLAPSCSLHACSRERAAGILTNLVAAARRAGQ